MMPLPTRTALCKEASTIPTRGTSMEGRASGAEAPTVSALAEPTSATPELLVDTTQRATTLTLPATGIYDIVALRAQGSHGITRGAAEIRGQFSLSAGEAPPIVDGADGA
jgi:hypothetical protein